jgi:hypothetical protein
MTRTAHDIDDVIRTVLGQADAELADRFREQSSTELLAEAFRSRNRRLAIGGAVATLVLFLAGIFCGVRFLQATDQRAMLLWGGGLLLCFGAVTALKIWYWLEMNRLALTRDIKRVELRVTQLAQALRDAAAGRGSDAEEGPSTEGTT